MARDDMTPLLILGGLGIAAYVLYQNGMLAQWFPSLFGTAAAPTTTPPTTTAPAAAPSYPLGVSIQNTSGGSSSAFTVGQNWSVTVTGPPNTQVTATASFGGTSQGPTVMGTTNAQGQLVITGSMAQGNVGSWVEQWFVGGQSAGQLTFSVSAAGTSGIGQFSFYGRGTRVPRTAVHSRSGFRVYR